MDIVFLCSLWIHTLLSKVLCLLRSKLLTMYNYLNGKKLLAFASLLWPLFKLVMSTLCL